MALKPIKVSQLNKYIGRVLQTDPILGNVSVVGEISNLKYHGSGHVFFTLKDEGSRISCFMPSSSVEKLRYELTDGMEVIVIGYISVYEKSGYYSLNVRDVQVSGEGNLSVAFKALYERLRKEGLFDEKNKKAIPVFPKRVCVITSPTGAAVRDVLKIIRSRNDVVDVLVYPCLVQGDNAAADIAAAINHVNQMSKDAENCKGSEDFPDCGEYKKIDVIIVGRGGGSREELWAFNEEIVARSIFASEIPVISAVGHETDFSISDYVADSRAETPTAAAAMAVPDTFQLRERMDELIINMKRGLQNNLNMKENRLMRHNPEMFGMMLENRLNIWKQRLENKSQTMTSSIEKRIDRLAADTEKCRIMLEAGDPERIVKRGYAIVADAGTGKIISGVAGLNTGDKLKITMKDGTVYSDVAEISGTEKL